MLSYLDDGTPVNTSTIDPEIKSESEGDITLSPFYHSSVNEITQPDRYVAMSRYFVLRWQRDLGPTGTAILLHLRAECFSNRKTGELRDTKQTAVQTIADSIGVSDKTVRREFISNKALQRFVRVQREFAQDAKRGGYRNAPSSYQVSMDDPLHPADEAKLTAIVRRKAQEADKGGRGPKTALDRARRQAAQSGALDPDPASGQNDPASPPAACGQNDRTQTGGAQRPVNLAHEVDILSPPPVNLAPPPVILTARSGQNDRALNHDSETTKEITLTTTTTLDTQAGADLTGASSPTQAEEVGVVLFDSLVWEDQDEESVIEALRLEAEASAPVSEDAPEPAPAPEPPPVPAAPLVTPPDAPLVTADTDRAVRRAASDLADASGLRQCDLDDYISAWRADGLGDDDIAQVLVETISVMAAKQPPPRDPKAFAEKVLANKIKTIRVQAQASPESSLNARITDKLADLPTVLEADLDAIRGRFQLLDEGDRKEINRRASLLVRDAAGSEAAYKSIPDAEHRALMARVKPALFLAWEQAIAARPKPEVMQAGVANLRNVMVNLGLKEKGENV